MTTKTEQEWEELDSLEQLKLGDEVEYRCLGSHREFRYWGKVIDIQKDKTATEVMLVRLEGDWSLVPSSFNAYGQSAKNLVTRKVVPPKFPTEVGAVIAYKREARDGTLEVATFVRIDDRADNAVWVKASNGERWAEWELELIHVDETLTVVSDGT